MLLPLYRFSSPLELSCGDEDSGGGGSGGGANVSGGGGSEFVTFIKSGEEFETGGGVCEVVAEYWSEWILVEVEEEVPSCEDDGDEATEMEVSGGGGGSAKAAERDSGRSEVELVLLFGGCRRREVLVESSRFDAFGSASRPRDFRCASYRLSV